MNFVKKRNSEDGQLGKGSTGLPFFSLWRRNSGGKLPIVLFVVTLLVITGFLMTAIVSAVKLNESSVRMSELKKEITALEKQKNELESELEKKNDMVFFEEYASKTLGMLKGDENRENDRDDKIE